MTLLFVFAKLFFYVVVPAPSQVNDRLRVAMSGALRRREQINFLHEGLIAVLASWYKVYFVGDDADVVEPLFIRTTGQFEDQRQRRFHVKRRSAINGWLLWRRQCRSEVQDGAQFYGRNDSNGRYRRRDCNGIESHSRSRTPDTITVEAAFKLLAHGVHGDSQVIRIEQCPEIRQSTRVAPHHANVLKPSIPQFHEPILSLC